MKWIFISKLEEIVYWFGWVMGDAEGARESYSKDYSDGLATDVSYQNKSEEERKKEGSHSVWINFHKSRGILFNNKRSKSDCKWKRDQQTHQAEEVALFSLGQFSRRERERIGWVALCLTTVDHIPRRETNILILFSFSKEN